MLECDSTIVSLGEDRLAIYLPVDLVKDSAFTYKKGDSVRVKVGEDCITVCKKEVK